MVWGIRRMDRDSMIIISLAILFQSSRVVYIQKHLREGEVLGTQVGAVLGDIVTVQTGMPLRTSTVIRAGYRIFEHHHTNVCGKSIFPNRWVLKIACVLLFLENRAIPVVFLQEKPPV